MTRTLHDKIAEINANVWDHAADEFQRSFDERRPLTSEERSQVGRLHEVALRADDDAAAAQLQSQLKANPKLIYLILQLTGLTRNKILQDLKASSTVKDGGVRVPSSAERLARHDAWPYAATYLLTRLRQVFSPIDPKNYELSDLYESLNQSTFPGYIRQERAKRSGHEAEYRLAIAFFSVGLDFEPKQKAENPLCRDALINGISFDLVSPHTERPLVVFKSTVHTSNIGQFGESKDALEAREAREWLDQFDAANRPTLVALIDGVGFDSNRAGLEGVLSDCDEFCQFRTLWKALLIAGHRLNKPLTCYLPEDEIESHRSFLASYGSHHRIQKRETLNDVSDLVDVGSSLFDPISEQRVL